MSKLQQGMLPVLHFLQRTVLPHLQPMQPRLYTQQRRLRLFNLVLPKLPHLQLQPYLHRVSAVLYPIEW
jgi:hypothetical protein